VIFITGASAGIGAAVAREAARQGADVVLAARRQERLRTLAAEIESMGQRALIARCDVTRDQFETNVFGVLRTVMATREPLIAARGCLAIVGSVNGYVSFPGSSPYSMSKAAVHALAFTLWHELRPRGVGVTLVAPGFVKSEIRQIDNRGAHHPQARDHIPSWLSGSTEKTARQILRAVRKRRRVEVITGHARVAVFLQRHFHWLPPQLLYFFGMLRRANRGRHA
jgi:short-subunit dehydrogenase